MQFDILRIFNRYKIIMIILCAVLGILSCNEDSVTNSTETVKLVKVRVDLQTGFGNKTVFIKFNDESAFSANLSNMEPLAGPIATFDSYLHEGENNLSLLMHDLSLQSEIFSDSCSFILGDKEIYYLGLQFSDTLRFVLQDSPFFYL